MQLSDDRAVADGDVRKSELTRFVRDIDARFGVGARERQRHPRYYRYLTIWRRQRHRARNGARRSLRDGYFRRKRGEQDYGPADTSRNPHASESGKERARSIRLAERRACECLVGITRVLSRSRLKSYAG